MDIGQHVSIILILPEGIIILYFIRVEDKTVGKIEFVQLLNAIEDRCNMLLNFK